jgi:dethiobiotin synthetase
LNFPEKFVVAGIGTDVGKTFVSAILAAGLKCQYWKPIQSGLQPETDTERVKRWSKLPGHHFLPEAFRLELPASPHLAARAEGILIEIAQIQIPPSDGQLLIEMAGGLMVPINEEALFIDLLEKWRLPVVLVVQTYLGSINHSLLSIEALRTRQIPLWGLVMNESDQPASAEIIQKFANAPILATLPRFESEEELDFGQIFRDYFRH